MSENGIIIRIPKIGTDIMIPGEWVQKRDELIREAQGITVENGTQFEAASELLRMITKVSNALEKQRKDFVKPFNAASKGIKKAADEARQPLEVVKSEVNKKVSAYAAEQRRIEAEERKKAEQKAQEEAARKAAEQEVAASLGLDDEEPEEIIVENEAVAKRARSSSVAIVTSVVIAGMNDNKLPRPFLTPSMPAINAYIREHKQSLQEKLKELDEGETIEAIPGVMVRLETKARSR